MKFSVEIGREFPIDDVEVLAARSEYEKSRTRNTVTLVLIFVIVVALAGAAVIGIADGTMDEVRGAWAGLSLPLGWIMKAYFDEESRRGRPP